MKTKGIVDWKNFEIEVMNDIEGSLTLMSGGLAGWSGDVVTEKMMIECKFSEQDQIDLKADWLIKLYSEAASERKYPILAIRMTIEYGTYFALVPTLETGKRVLLFNSTVRLTNEKLENLRIMDGTIRSSRLPVEFQLISNAEVPDYVERCSKEW